MVHAASAEFIADLVRRSKAEIRDCDAKAAFEAENIFWLQISVVNSERVAVLDCIDELQEDIFDEVVLSKISAAVEDLCEQIVVRGIVHHDVGVISLLNDTMQGDYTRVGGGQLVQSDFADVDLPLTG